MNDTCMRWKSLYHDRVKSYKFKFNPHYKKRLKIPTNSGLIAFFTIQSTVVIYSMLFIYCIGQGVTNPFCFVCRRNKLYQLLVRAINRYKFIYVRKNDNFVILLKLVGVFNKMVTRVLTTHTFNYTHVTDSHLAMLVKLNSKHWISRYIYHFITRSFREYESF